MILKNGDRCIVVAISKDDAWFGERKNIIGKKVMFLSCDGQNTGQTLRDGFISCKIDWLSPVGADGPSYFYRVKLKKIKK